MRIERNIARGAPISIRVNGDTLSGFAGETIAAVMLAHGRTVFRRDGRGTSRGLYCNMGTCCECMVTILGPDRRRVRACMADARDGMDIHAGD